MTDTDDSLRPVAEKIAGDADAAVDTESIHKRLTELIEEYKVPRAEAERSLRYQYDALADTLTDTTPPEGVADLLGQIEDGHVTAVRTVGSEGSTDRRYIVAGCIELSEDLSDGWVATFHDATAWRWQAGEPGTVEPYLSLINDEGPPKFVRHGERDDYNANPGLRVSDGELAVVECGPVLSGGRVEYYAPRRIGTVGAVRSGQIVEPKDLLPGATEVDT